MPKKYTLGNGNLLVNFDASLQMSDCYYPYVGQENHSAFGKLHRVGVWVDGHFRWLSDPTWQIESRYLSSTLVAESTAIHQELQIKLTFHDSVYTTHDVLLRRVTIENLSSHVRDVKIYFAHDFYLYGDKKQDTALFDPKLNAVIHYRQRRYFLLNGQWDETGDGVSSFAVGKSNYGAKEGTWRDAEDGHLGQNPIEQGSVDSVIEFKKAIPSQESRVLWFWMAAGKSQDDIEKNNQRIKSLTPQLVYEHTHHYWEQLARKPKLKLEGVDKDIQALWRQSLLIIRTQIDNRGAIIASNDSDIMKFNKDTYTYMWPRDGALVSMALSKTGYHETVKNFILFCRDILSPGGYVLHKFNPDQSLGSSWHPHIKHGQPSLPIQEDESALILVALGEYYKYSMNIEFVQSVFNDVVLRIGNFLLAYIDHDSGLPRPSYDLWEEQYGIFSYTVATVIAGLKSAGDLSECTGHYEDAQRFREGAKHIQKAFLKFLYSREHGRFLKCLKVSPSGEFIKDNTVDASLAFIWMLDVLPASDERVVKTMQAIEAELTIHNDIGGIARYTGDTYHRNWDQHYSPQVPGNPWIICTLWLAQWQIQKSRTSQELKKAYQWLQWTADQANSCHILPEQIDPFTREPLSVAPLTWSHAVLVETVIQYSQKFQDLK